MFYVNYFMNWFTNLLWISLIKITRRLLRKEISRPHLWLLRYSHLKRPTIAPVFLWRFLTAIQISKMPLSEDLHFNKKDKESLEIISCQYLKMKDIMQNDAKWVTFNKRICDWFNSGDKKEFTCNSPPSLSAFQNLLPSKVRNQNNQLHFHFLRTTEFEY